MFHPLKNLPSPSVQAAIFRPLKAFLIELALGWVGHKTGMTLDPKFKLPKMKYKGDEVGLWPQPSLQTLHSHVE